MCCVQAFSAGVGNWVADEVLYQAQLYPEVKASTLTEEEIQRLHKALKDVPATAVAAEADSEKFPPDWLFHVRWGGPKKSPKVNGHPQGRRPGKQHVNTGPACMLSVLQG